jgi:DNA-directed RNA polymerase subunit N (RpoN/RPB10)
VQCYRERLRCTTCGTHVGHEAVLLEGETHIYCRYCFEQRPRCDTCGRPVGAHYWNRTDGRKLCDRCQSTAISDTAEAHALYRRVRADLARYLGISLRESCQLKLVSRNQLLHLIDKSSLYHLDADSRGRCFGLFVREGRHRAMFLEYGLPRIVLSEVMAHEYAHAWQSENWQREAPPEVQEGFAEWVAYKLLEAWGCRRRSERMLRRDDLYGRGLRLVLDWEEQGGAVEVFRRVGEYA